MIVEIPPPEQPLTEIGLGLMWLDKYKYLAKDLNKAEMYNSYAMKMVGEIRTYLDYYNQEDFFAWMDTLEIDEETKKPFYLTFEGEKESPIPF